MEHTILIQTESSYFRITPNLRWLKHQNGTLELQQAWQGDRGDIMWQAVEMVDQSVITEGGK